MPPFNYSRKIECIADRCHWPEQVFFDDRSLDGDKVAGYDGFEVVVDRMSVPYLSGATIDFADRIDAQGFTIDNPNATGSCACGDSFH